MSNPVKLFIVEGEHRDYRFVNELTRCFFSRGKHDSRIINLPASQNLYMLYQKLAEDDFETDIVEILRDSVPSAKAILEGVCRQDIDEVFMFFDYDVHQNNIPEEVSPKSVLEKLIAFFDNETEQGKLYISYPMVEALYDYQDSECLSFSNCYTLIDDVKKYKDISGKDNPKASIHFAIEDWRMILNIFYLRIKCLFEIDFLSFEYYRQNISPFTIFQAEKILEINSEKVFVLSGFPEFLFDYFKKDFWTTMVQRTHLQFGNCPKL